MNGHGMRAWPGLVLALVVLLALAGCAGESTGPEAGASQPPAVVIAAPAPGAAVQKGQEVAIQSMATDDKGVVRVELWVDGSLARSDASPQAAGQTPFVAAQLWRAEVVGSHAILVKAYDADGQFAQTDVLIVNVGEGAVSMATATATSQAPAATATTEPAATDVPPTDVPPTDVPPTDLPPTTLPPTAIPPTAVPPTAAPDNAPTVQIISPASPHTTARGSSVKLTIKATDDKGVTRIELWVDGAMYRKDEVGGGKTVNWEMTWTASTLGTYVLEVKSLDTKFKLSPVAKLTVHVEESVPPITLPDPYDDLWAEWGGTAGALGNPVGDVVKRFYAGQEFDHGYMFWRDNTSGADQIYMLRWGAGDSQAAGDEWEVMDDTWQEGVNPEYQCDLAVPPLGPRRGFGKLWCTYPTIRTALGAAVAEERGQDGGWLQFEHGIALWDSLNNRAFVLVDGDGWQTFQLP